MASSQSNENYEPEATLYGAAVRDRAVTGGAPTVMIDGMGVITGISVAHGRADVDTIETAWEPTRAQLVETLVSEPAVDEAFALRTCNRAEAYVVTAAPRTGRELLSRHVPGAAPEERVSLDHDASLRHLMRVATGLESAILGDDQILGQLTRAYEDATAVEAIGPVLEEAITKAIRVGKRARTETAINEGVTSVGTAAARATTTACDGHPETGLVVGTGKMGRGAVRRLQDRVTTLVLANRTVSTARSLGESLSCDATAIEMDGDALAEAIPTADLVITATGAPGTVLETEWFEAAGETVVVDIAQPRDVPPAVASLPNVTFEDLDTIQSVIEGESDRRRAAVTDVEALIEDEFNRLIAQYKRKRADAIIAQLYKRGERLKQRELETAVTELDGDVTPAQRRVIESMADSLVNQLLAAPTKSLRDAAETDDWTTINTALQLFDPEFEREPTERSDDLVH